MSTVSILMNCYNGEKYVREAIESVYSQSFKDWELIFIDNCSTDKSGEIAKSFDSRVKYYKTPAFVSLCAARVWAQPFLKGEFFSVLDCDDVLLPTKLEKQVRVFEKNPDVGIVYCNSEFFTDSGSRKNHYSGAMPQGRIFRQLLPRYFFSLEAMMARRSVMDQHGLYFDPKYNITSDAEFFIRLSYYTDACYIDEVLAKWRYGHVSESIRQAISFPREFELLLEDLQRQIPQFESDYADEILVLKTRIANMYGMAHWQEGDRTEARNFFAKAFQGNKQYLVPYLLSFLVAYPTYRKIRSLKVRA